MATWEEREQAAERAGREADAAFTRACEKLDLPVRQARLAPLLVIAETITELEIA